MKNKLKIILLLIVISFFTAGFVLASSDDNVWGWAWSENVGWLSFNCTNTEGCDSSNYGVNIEDSGYFSTSSYAWSENIGWISFNRSETGSPPALPDYNPYLAKVDLKTGEVSGWARALAYGDGWSGWIKLRGISSEAKEYGVSIDKNNGEFSGWAWSDMVIGWISFNCKDRGVCGTSDYKVKTSFSFLPSVSNLRERWVDPCTDSLHPTLSWEYNDGTPDGYQLEIYSDSDLANLIYEYTATGTISTAHTANYEAGTCHLEGNGFKNEPTCDLEYGEITYWWRVKAKRKETGIWSEWSTPASFTTYLHSWPSPSFKCSASSTGPWVDCSTMRLAVDEIIYFHDESETFGEATITDWYWNFGDGATSTLQNPSHSYSNPGNYSVILEVTDSDGYSCPTDPQDIKFRVTVEIPLPEWKEIPPFIWLKKLLASILEFLEFLEYLTV